MKQVIVDRLAGERARFSALRWMIGGLMALLFVVVAQASQTVPDGKWWSVGSNVWYVHSSFGNLLVADGTAQGSELDGEWYTRANEKLLLELVPSVGFTTGSTWPVGATAPTINYRVIHDGVIGYRGEFYALLGQWVQPNPNTTWSQLWDGAMTISLQAFNGQYLCAEGGGGQNVVANRNGVGTWEQFSMWSLSGGYLKNGDTVTMVSRDASFLCADKSNADKLMANRNGIGDWEKFMIVKVTEGDEYIRPGDTVAFVSESGAGKFWCANNGGGSDVVVNRLGVGTWERFVIGFPTPYPR